MSQVDATVIVTLILVARVAARFHKGADAASWADTASGFQARMSTRLTHGLPTALAARSAMVVTDGVIFVVSLLLGAVTFTWWRWQIGSGRLASPAPVAGG